MNKKAALTDKHKKIQREIVLKWIRDNKNWKNVIFFKFSGLMKIVLI